LTGVLNRQGFDYAAAALIDRVRPRTLSIAIADIDRFKAVNDRYGHAAGDATLTAFAAHLARVLERGESVARIGGEEFALLLPGVDAAQALARIEPVRRDLAMLKVESQPGIAVTASFGIAEREPGEALEALLERADQALYQSKREGRDRTTVAPPSSARAEPA
jgi:diguanylate cyclase (GGDEF)-like protein